MKAIGITSAAIMILLTGVAAPSYAQQAQPGRQGDHSAQQRSRNEGPQRKQRRSDRVREQRRVRQDAWQQHRARSWQAENRSWQQRGGYDGYRVPDRRFNRYFGPRHQFRINRLPFRVAAGLPSFQYRGYWLSLVDPWPEQWANNWYDDDSVYVNYVDNGYYLYNRRQPQFRIALRISL